METRSPLALLVDGVWVEPQRDLLLGWAPFSRSWPTAATAISPGESSMRGILASRSDEGAFFSSPASLAETLEVGPIHPRYSLSAKAAAGILRRAQRRGRELPERLRLALEALAGTAVPTDYYGEADLNEEWATRLKSR